MYRGAHDVYYLALSALHYKQRGLIKKNTASYQMHYHKEHQEQHIEG